MTPEHRRFVTALGDGGHLSAGWRPSFEAVPRHLFVPDDVWAGAAQVVPVHRADDPQVWLDLVYSDEPITTQVNDGQPDDGPAYPTSSTSKPSVMTMMLNALAVDPGDKVLEIGTGTGWNAGLLAHRLGGDQVVSIEIDPAVAERARKSLAEAGQTPTLIVGDGTAGWPQGAPYDAVIATAAVQTVPYPWIAQAKPGARIVVPYGNGYDNGALVRLTVRADGAASGHFSGDVAFMWVRAQRTARGWLAANAPDELDAPETTTTLTPWTTVHDFDQSFAIGVQLPDVQHSTYDGENTDHWYEIWYYHPQTGSIASVVATSPDDAYIVRQTGPRRLWDEVETAHAWWVAQGKPDYTRFGLTVTADRQWTWLDTPDQPVPV